MKLLYPDQKFNRLGVAVSGGADSVALLRILLQEKDRFAEELIVYTVNHGIRGQEAERDASFVQDLCARLAVPCRSQAVMSIGSEAKKGGAPFGGLSKISIFAPSKTRKTLSFIYLYYESENSCACKASARHTKRG
jgi:NH3-dependent NAD+ synthetase